MKTTAMTSTAKLLSYEIRRVELSVAVIWSEIGGARVSSCVDEVLICVCTVIQSFTSTAHFRCGKIIVVVGPITSLSEMILAIVRTRVSLGVEMS